MVVLVDSHRLGDELQEYGFTLEQAKEEKFANQEVDLNHFAYEVRYRSAARRIFKWRVPLLIGQAVKGVLSPISE